MCYVFLLRLFYGTKNVNVSVLTLRTLGKNFSRQHLKFLIFPQEIGFNISCKLSPLETICMKCQNLFPVKNIINLSSAEHTHRVVIVECFPISAKVT